jgi:hypothetical protein
VLCQKLQRAVRIENASQAAQLILVAPGADDIPTSEAINNEDRDTKGVEFLCPIVLKARRFSGAVQQNDCRQPVGSRPRDAKLAANRDALGVSLAGQELLIGWAMRLKRVQFQPCDLSVSRGAPENYASEGQDESKDSGNERDMDWHMGFPCLRDAKW